MTNPDGSERRQENGPLVPVHPAVRARMETLLEWMRSGELAGIGFVACLRDGTVATGYARGTARVADLSYGSALLQERINKIGR